MQINLKWIHVDYFLSIIKFFARSFIYFKPELNHMELFLEKNIWETNFSNIPLQNDSIESNLKKI